MKTRGLLSTLSAGIVSIVAMVALQGCLPRDGVADGGADGGANGGDDGGADAGRPFSDGGAPGTDAGPADGGGDAGLPGYVFLGEYRADAGDLSGIRVCDYPSLTNCSTDADGKSRGRMREWSSRLAPASNVHLLKLSFRSVGYLARNPGAHFAIGLRGRITKDQAGEPIAVNGRGLIFGDLSAHPTNGGNPACGARMLQVESYFGDDVRRDPRLPANRIFPETCSDSVLEDGQWYRLEVAVSRDRKIAYRLLDEQRRLVQVLTFQDPTDNVDLALTDVFLGHVFDTRVATRAGNWALFLRDIELSESPAPLESLIGEPVMTFERAHAPLADDALVTAADVADLGVSVGDFPPSRQRLFGCASPATLVDGGTGCADRADFRTIDFSGDPSFLFDGQRLWLFAPAYRGFPPDTYRLVLRTNPQSSLVQASVRIVTP